jgi:hypothetical protein
MVVYANERSLFLESLTHSLYGRQIQDVVRGDDGDEGDERRRMRSEVLWYGLCVGCVMEEKE